MARSSPRRADRSEARADSKLRSRPVQKPEASPPSSGAILESSFTMPALIALAAFVAYLPALRAGYVWDDQAMTENPFLGTARGLFRIWFDPQLKMPREEHYWPLVYTTFWIERRLWGLQPLGYHLVNVLLHILNSIGIGLLLRRIAMPGAWLAAAIFALHPVHVESVAWVIERKDTLSALFYLLAFGAYLRFDESRTSQFFLLALVLYIAAMLSKSVALTLPLAIALVLLIRRRRLYARDLAPLLLMALAGAALVLWDLRSVARNSGPQEDLSVLQRMLIASRATGFYLGKLFWPSNLAAIYPRWKIEAGLGGGWIFPLAAILAAAAFALGRHRLPRVVPVALLFFIITLGPMLGFISFGFMEYSFVADRFQYLASIGPIALISAGGASFGSFSRVRSTLQSFSAVTFAVVLGLVTWSHAALYEHVKTLFGHTLSKNPSAWVAHNNLGFALTQERRFDEAVAHFNEALALKPRFPDALNNLGWAQAGLGRLDEAAGSLNRALELLPNYPTALSNLGSVLGMQGKPREAAERFSQALALEPDYPQALFNRGVAYSQLNRLDDAIADFERALRLQPNFPQAKEQLRLAQLRRGGVSRLPAR